jgi:TolB-like protein
MYQHQHAPLSRDQLECIPQPVVVLLEVLLEKDPKQRFQSPADLLNALPKVTGAVKARRTITHQTSRAILDQPLGATGKPIEVLTNFRAVIAARRVRLILLLAIGVGTILAFNVFFGPKSPTPQASGNSSPAVTAPEKSVAVLPFENISANKDDAYFADGVQDEILNNLAKIAQLKVISRTSVMQYRADAKRDLRQIANALGVASVLEGTVRRAGNRVRVSIELVDAHNDNTIWADSYDRDSTDIFAIQSEIAKTIASKLSARLSPHEQKDIAEAPTSNAEAYDLYLRAKELVANAELFSIGDEREDLLNAITFVEEAARKDPKFVLAYCLAARAHDDLYMYYDRSMTRRALGDTAVQAATRLQPDLPEVHLAAARHFYNGYHDYEKARLEIAVAERALPNSS